MAAAGCCKNVDWDSVFSYDTVRIARIRDARLGMTMRGTQLAIFIYIIVYQVTLRQAYMVESPIVGSVRVQLKRPEPLYRWPNGSAPYCLGSSPPSPVYTYPAPGQYTYTGGGGVLAPQANCLFYDEYFAVPDPLENDAAYLPTRITTSTQVASPMPDCAALNATYCSFNTTSRQLNYVADPELFTLLIDHSFTSGAGISRSSTEMAGFMLNSDGRVLDPCAAYSGLNLPCPSYIAVGVAGKPDIFPLRTLLNAANIGTLDQAAGSTADLSSQTRRNAGLVVTIVILYENYFLPLGKFNPGTGTLDSSEVKYYYVVSVVPNVEYKAEFTVTPNNALPSSVRTIYNTHGVRIVLEQAGRIGFGDFQAFLINAVVSLGLLSVATLVTDLIMLNLCPLRHLYAQYKERKSVSLADFKGEVPKEVMEHIKRTPDLVDPTSSALAQVMESAKAAGSRRSSTRMEDEDGHVALAPLSRGKTAGEVVTNPLNGASGVASGPNRGAPTRVAADGSTVVNGAAAAVAVPEWHKQV